MDSDNSNMYHGSELHGKKHCNLLSEPIRGGDLDLPLQGTYSCICMERWLSVTEVTVYPVEVVQEQLLLVGKKGGIKRLGGSEYFHCDTLPNV